MKKLSQFQLTALHGRQLSHQALAPAKITLPSLESLKKLDEEIRNDVGNGERVTLCVGEKLLFVRASVINYLKKIIVAKGGKVYRFK